MTIKEEFLPYVDGNSLMSPGPVPTGSIRGSDNGTLYTSEYTIILLRNDQLEPGDITKYSNLILTCVGTEGELNRAPSDTTYDPDDYHGVYNAHKQLGIKPKFDLPFELERFPQLLAMDIATRFPSLLDPIDWFVRLTAFPLFLASALIIVFSNMFDPIDDSNSRRLAWHLVECTKQVSLLCYLASLIWYHRLYSSYPNGMKDIAGIYYQPNGLNDNPYSKYWIDK